ncbi:MarR family winged helix-turn-helix transcriptional regulator [Streptomyces chrestomyceticus]|uniref:MarR family winged helix-turn-helix transcriptional regulator n=1 Tax=Streptomyces chrestomyceticus TaxID=68185 RepID=UPI0037BA78FB
MATVLRPGLPRNRQSSSNSRQFSSTATHVLLFQLALAHRGHAAAMLRTLDLHLGQELLLMQLFDHDSQTQSELLERVGLDHSTVSKSLRHMQEAGLVTREPAAHDRRVMVVSLTDTGRALQEPIADMWRTLEQISVRDLPPDQAEMFTRCAHNIEKSVRDHSRQPPVG